MGIQVNNATKDRQGNSLPVLSRQFISFSYGGKNIEDFGLLAVFSNDRLEKNIYSSFEDTTTQQSEIDGQIFWVSKYNANELNFTLATDGMTSKQLEDFKKWFIPGVERELILSEHSNRMIGARVFSAPNISLLPFEQEIEINIGGSMKKTRTSLYKGEISLSFVMDKPYWSAINSYLEQENEENYKIVYEDNVPFKSMLSYNCFLANNKYYNGTNIINNSGQTLLYSKEQSLLLYYCGTAPSSPIISFTITPQVTDTYYLVSFPKDSYLHIGGKTINFTLPQLLTSYNQAIQNVIDFKGTSILDLRKIMRDSLYDYFARAWAIAVIDRMIAQKQYVDVNGLIQGDFKTAFYENMKLFLFKDASTIQSLKIKIDNQLGETTITTKVRQFNADSLSESSFIEITENAGDMIKSKYLTIENPKDIIMEKGKITISNLLEVSTNCDLNDLIINYRYLYL